MPRPFNPFMHSAGKRSGTNANLREFEGFGSNPGALRARLHIPVGAAGKRPLVVVLHGCTQTAAGYDAGAGWSALADELGFMLLLPEQQRANNPNLCFNWFSPRDIRRGEGEALSIHQMITTLVRDHGADADRVFVTGLSAGGAMASVMLATYPELFAGGAIIAGLPYRTASGVPQALDRMAGRGMPSPEELTSLVRQASSHAGPWPTISVWHGDKDSVVSDANARAIVAQWRSIHGVTEEPTSIETVDGHAHRIWRDAAGRAAIEHYVIAGMGHGTPLGTVGSDRCGKAGPYMLDVGISSTRHIARSWGLGDAPQAAAAPGPELDPEQQSADRAVPVRRSVRPERIYDRDARQERATSTGVGKIIEDALRAAGLMR